MGLPCAQAGMHTVDIIRALVTKLQCRPLAHTLPDTSQWLAMAPPTAAPKSGPARPGVGLPAEREAALLRAGRRCSRAPEPGLLVGPKAGFGAALHRTDHAAHPQKTRLSAGLPRSVARAWRRGFGLPIVHPSNKPATVARSPT